jgi:hypothetical protein
VKNSPLFEMPPAQKVELSRALSIPAYRLVRGETAKWTQIKVKGPRPCNECFWRQHETNGDSGQRRQARQRRTHPRGGTPIELCGEHAQLWRDRDTQDVAGRAA